MIKILMHGCNGKMGRMITELVKNDDGAVIAAGVDTYTGIANDYPVYESIDQCDTDVDVVIDFSNAGAVDALLDYCAEKKIPVVLCTTGLSEEQLEKVRETSDISSSRKQGIEELQSADLRLENTLLKAPVKINIIQGSVITVEFYRILISKIKTECSSQNRD